MQEIEEIAEGNHDGGDAADNVEQSKKVGLSEMPVEILEHILVHLDDKSLLRASHVCTKFASVAGTAFAQKYSNKYYNKYYIIRRSDNMAFHQVMLFKYGDKIRKLRIDVDKENERMLGLAKRMLDLAERTCCNLNSLDLGKTSKIILPSGLKEARLAYVANLNRASFTEFINKNQQLEILRLESHRIGLLAVLDGLNNLKTLECESWFTADNDLPNIRLAALETLELSLSDTDGYARVLRAITCNELKSLFLSGVFSDVPDDVIEQICTFRKLVSLRLGMFEVTEDQLKTLARRLPHITEFGMGMVENVDHTIQLALRCLPKLKKLTIRLGDDDYRELSVDLQKSIRDFHARFVVANTKIELEHCDDIISISKDRTVAFDGNTDSLELLWMENFDVKNLRKVLDALPKEYQMYHLKFINDCADATLDFSKFLHTCFDWTVSAEIKSNGPVTVNANVTRLPTFFPRLTKLKIQLENHSAIDLLQKLDKEFCKQIAELSIDTKYIQNDHDHELEHENDITHILAKFENFEITAYGSAGNLF